MLPIAEEQRPWAEELVRRAVGQGPRAELVGPEHGSLGARIRGVRLVVPYQAVIGEREGLSGGSGRLRETVLCR